MNAPDIHPHVSPTAPERLAGKEDRGEKGGPVGRIETLGRTMTD